MPAPAAGRLATLLWSALLQWSRVGANAIVFLVIARWLDLESIGSVAAVQAPVLVLQAVLTATIPDHIVQYDGNQRSQSTMFWVSLALGTTFTLALALAAPVIAHGLPAGDAINYARVLSICPLLWSISSVFEGLLRKALDTRRLGIRTALASLLSGTIAIVAVMLNAGGWAIVAFIVLNALFNAVLVIMASAWRPSLKFDAAFLRAETPRLLALGGRHLLSGAVMPLLQYTVAIRVGVAAGGAFQIAARMFTLVDALAVTPYRFLVMPLFARMPSPQHITRNLYRALAVGSIIAAPCYFALAAISPALLPLVLGPVNGRASAELLPILCLYGPIAILPSVIVQALAGRGHLHVAFVRSLLMYGLAVLPAVAMAAVSVRALVTTYVVSGGLFGIVIGAAAAKQLLGAEQWRVLQAWLGPFVAGAMLLGLPAAIGFVVPGPDLAVVLLFAGLAPPLYLAGLAILARPQVRIVRDLMRPRRPPMGPWMT